MTNLTTRSEPTSATTGTATDVPTGIGHQILWLGPTGIVVAIGLSVAEWLLVRSPENSGTVAAATVAMLMTAPVVLARRWPITAAAAVTVAAVLNGLMFADLVRCGGAVPAALYIAFAVGARTRTADSGWARPIGGLGLVVAALGAQYIWDPALNADATFLLFGPGLALLAWTGGIGCSALMRRRRSTTLATAR